MKRRFFILKAIVESFIESAEPVGSKYLVEKHKMDISPSTIRNDMAVLEHLGLIHQPFTSAGRVPTDLGFRVFVDELMDRFPQVQKIKKQAILHIKKMHHEEKLYDAVSLLARTCDNVSFAVLPGEKNTYYLGLANILKKPEFAEAAQAYTVVKILEDTERFVNTLQKLGIERRVKIYIGRENIISEIKSCSIIATSYKMKGYGSGIIGVLGPIRMNYPFNMASLEYVRDMMEEGE